MSSVSSGRDEPVPFLLQLFYRTGSFHTPEDFSSHTLPSHVSVYTGQDCTLHQLALELAALKPSAIPTPAIGTRLAFQLVCPDLRNSNGISNSPPRYAVKDLGSIVLGGHGPGADHDAGLFDISLDDQKTLADARFVVGDFISCAVLPALADGSVAPVPTTKREPIPGARDSRPSWRGDSSARNGGFGRGGHRGGRSGWKEGAGGRIPTGEWRRGERLPEGPKGRLREKSNW